MIAVNRLIQSKRAMKNYCYRDDIAIADAAFDAWADSPEELFRAAVEATTGVMIDNPSSISCVQRINISLESPDIEMLLFRLLDEIVYYKDAESLLLLASHLLIKHSGEDWALEGELEGEKIDPSKHDMVVDVKAVTLHRFSVMESEGGWKATVVLDI